MPTYSLVSADFACGVYFFGALTQTAIILWGVIAHIVPVAKQVVARGYIALGSVKLLREWMLEIATDTALLHSCLGVV